VNKKPEAYRQPWCDNCEGDGTSWLIGQRGVRWTVRDVQQANTGQWLCAICRAYPNQPIKAEPKAKMYTTRKQAA